MKPIEIKIIDIKGYRRKFAGRIDAIYLDGEIHIKNISGQVISGYSILIKYPIEILQNYVHGDDSRDHKYITKKTSNPDDKWHPDEERIFELKKLKIDKESIDRVIHEKINIKIYTEIGHLTKSYPVSELRVTIHDQMNGITIQDLFR